MDIIFNRLKTMYEDGKATDVTIYNAVVRRLITKKQYIEITGKEFIASK